MLSENHKYPKVERFSKSETDVSESHNTTDQTNSLQRKELTVPQINSSGDTD